MSHLDEIAAYIRSKEILCLTIRYNPKTGKFQLHQRDHPTAWVKQISKPTKDLEELLRVEGVIAPETEEDEFEDLLG